MSAPAALRALYAPPTNARLAIVADAAERLAEAAHRLALHPTQPEAERLQFQASAIARELAALAPDIEGGPDDDS